MSFGWLADEFAAKLTRALKEQIAAMRNEVLSAPHELGSQGGGLLSPHGEREWPAPKVVGINEAARLLGIRPSTLRVRVKQNRIRSVRIGRRVLVPMESIEKVVREGMPSRG